MSRLSSCHPASVVPWSGWPGLSGGVAFPKLSKLLNQEDALSAPCLESFRHDCGLRKMARCGFPWEKNHGKASRFFPDFLHRSTGREPLCATFFTESRMQFGDSTNIYKKFGFPDFLHRGTGREQLCATFFPESRTQFGDSTNINRKSRFALHPLRNCLSVNSPLRRAAPSRGAGMRTDVIRHFDVTLLFATPGSSRLQAVMSLGGGGRCTGRAPMLSQAGLSW